MGTEVEEGELWGAERGARQAGVAYCLEVLVIVLQFDPVGGERHGLVLHLERTVIHPDRDRHIREAPLPVEFPILEPQKSMFIEVAGVAGGEQDAVEELRRVPGTCVRA